MALRSIDAQGNLTWNCPHLQTEEPCGTSQSAHISHEHIQWCGSPLAKPEHHTVSLPVCPTCGAQTFLKVHFTSAELQAPNMIDPISKQPTASHAMAQRHMQLARQLIASGKKPQTAE